MVVRLLLSPDLLLLLVSLWGAGTLPGGDPLPARAARVADSGRPDVGEVVAVLPAACARMMVDGAPLFYGDGVFYRPIPSGYAVVRAPLGVRVPALPNEAVPVEIGAITVWYDRGTFYRNDAAAAAWVTVRPLLGAVVPSLPSDLSAIADIDGVLYYLYAGAFYRPMLQEGRTVYVVSLP
jgi:hypothetical protein